MTVQKKKMTKPSVKSISYVYLRTNAIPLALLRYAILRQEKHFNRKGESGMNLQFEYRLGLSKYGHIHEGTHNVK